MINNSSTVEFELWGNAGPSAFSLQETMLKSDKIWRTYLVINYVILWTFWTPLVRTHSFSALDTPCTYTFLQCFGTVGWVTGRAHIPQKFFLEQVEKENKGRQSSKCIQSW